MVRFGFKGGLELTQMEFSSDALRDANRAGFYIGPQVKFKLPVVGLGIDVSALYSRRSLKVEGEELRQESLLLPAHVRYGAAIGELVGVFLCAGPQLSFNLGDDILYQNELLKTKGVGKNIGICHMLLNMKKYLETGECPYSFARAMTDTYITQMFLEAGEKPFTPIRSKKLPWE